MSIICPAILAINDDEYHRQIEKVSHLARRIQIDLTDGQFAKSVTVKPENAWWPVGMQADFHLMYRNPESAIRTIIKHKPHMIIVHAEADGDFSAMANLCHASGVKVGVALLPQTTPENILPALGMIDHILIFSGDLGKFGGSADLRNLHKISVLKNLKHNLEIGWDGGVNDQNISQMVSSGVDVLNVGGYIQKAEDPAIAFHTLQRIADETGTT